jgi:hypothetical protein
VIPKIIKLIIIIISNCQSNCGTNPVRVDLEEGTLALLPFVWEPYSHLLFLTPQQSNAAAGEVRNT